MRFHIEENDESVINDLAVGSVVSLDTCHNAKSAKVVSIIGCNIDAWIEMTTDYEGNFDEPVCEITE